MRPVRAGAAAAAAWLAAAGPASAETAVGLTYKPIGVEYAGVELELGPLDLGAVGNGWRLGALAQARRFVQGEPGPWHAPETLTAWGRQAYEPWPGLELGWLLGASTHPPFRDGDGIDDDRRGRSGLVVGATFGLRSGDLWLRLSPNALLHLGPAGREPFWVPTSGIPLAEAGWRIFPQLEVSFRLADTFVRTAWLFG